MQPVAHLPGAELWGLVQVLCRQCHTIAVLLTEKIQIPWLLVVSLVPIILKTVVPAGRIAPAPLEMHRFMTWAKTGDNMTKVVLNQDKFTLERTGAESGAQMHTL